MKVIAPESFTHSTLGEFEREVPRDIADREAARLTRMGLVQPYETKVITGAPAAGQAAKKRAAKKRAAGKIG